jgi:hypothetical protein
MYKSLDGVLVELTAEEIAEHELNAVDYTTSLSESIRNRRDALIASTDWWVMPDRTATADQLAYRQALRDITAQAGFPTDITWPTKPE